MSWRALKSRTRARFFDLDDEKNSGCGTLEFLLPKERRSYKAGAKNDGTKLAGKRKRKRLQGWLRARMDRGQVVGADEGDTKSQGMEVRE